MDCWYQVSLHSTLLVGRKKIKEFSAVRVIVNQKRKYGMERRSERRQDERGIALC